MSWCRAVVAANGARVHPVRSQSILYPAGRAPFALFTQLGTKQTATENNDRQSTVENPANRISLELSAQRHQRTSVSLSNLAEVTMAIAFPAAHH